jgi:hypothetical protein
MLRIVQSRFLFVLAACALGVAGCGKSTEDKESLSPLTDTGGLLRYVPADTPYVFGTLAPPPDDFMDRIEPKLERLLAAYSEMLEAAMAEAESEEGDAEEMETMNGLLQEFRSVMSLDGLKRAGLTRNSTGLLYGNGLLPVLRITLSDATLFDDFITRLETKAGEQLAVAEVDGMPYRFLEDEGVRAIIATAGDELVLSVAPASLDDDGLARLLGLELPATNIAQTGKLREIADEYGFLHEYVGLVDTVRLADTFIDEPGGLDALLLDMAGYDATTLSDDCKAEFRTLARIAPRVVTGYEEVSAEKIRTVSVVELREDIASEFTAFVSQVPGLGAIYDGLFSFGMSMDMEALRTSFVERVAALQEAPWECEYLAELQNGLFAAREQALTQPVPPVVYGFHGFLAVVEELEGFDFGKKQPPEKIDASLLLAIDNAQGLLAMGQAMIPQLAELAIEPDGKAHRIALPMGQGSVDSAWVALTDSAIAVSVSEDAEASLPALVKAAGGTPPPFMSMGLDGTRYYTLLGTAMRSSEDEEMSERMREATAGVFEAAADFYERLQVDVVLTKRGIEIENDLILAD